MNIENGFNRIERFDNEEYKRLMDSTIEKQTSLMEQVDEIIIARGAVDIYKAEKRARGCGCGNCFKDLNAVKEWYR